MKYTASLVCALIFFAFAAWAQPQLDKVKAQVEQDYSYLKDLYVHLHQNPELSFYETETAKRVAQELRQAGFAVTENFGGTGVVGVMKNGKGPTVLVRADMDALPVEEKTGLPYASTVKTKDEAGNEVSVMHACGHDVHMTSMIGAARVLSQLKKSWSGTLILIGQPAEERSGGAKAMLKEGLYEKFPKPDYAIALHASAALPAGKVSYTPKAALANVDMVRITVHGKGGHGAYPHTTIDPIFLASKIVVALQGIVSREVSPLEPAVVTVGSIHGGTKGNIIPDKVVLELTLRSYSDEVRNHTLAAIRRIIRGEGIAAGLPDEKLPEMLVHDESTPTVFNDPELTKRLAQAFVGAVGAENVIEMPPVMGGEDFGRFSKDFEEVAGVIYWLGAVDPQVYQEAQENGEGLPSLHSPFFAPLPEPTLKTGAITMSAAVLELLGK